MPAKKTLETFIQEVEEKRSDLAYIEGFLNYRQKVSIKGKECGHTWQATPKNLLNRNSGCPICARKKQSERQQYTQEEFEELISQRFPSIEILSKYKGNKHLITFRCKKCHQKMQVEARTLLDGRANTHARGCGTKYLPQMSDESLTKDYQDGMTRTEIADKYGCTTTTVSNKLNALGLYYRAKRK